MYAQSIFISVPRSACDKNVDKIWLQIKSGFLHYFFHGKAELINLFFI